MAGLTLLALLFATLAYSLPSPGLQAYRLDAADFQLRPTGSTQREDSFVSQPSEHSLPDRRALATTTYRRANILLDEDRHDGAPPPEPWMVWIVDVPPGTEFRFSRALLGESVPRTTTRWPAPSVSLLAPIPRYAYLPGRNDIDLAFPPSPARTSLGGIYLGPEAVLRPAALAQTRRAAPLPGATVIAGLIVLTFCAAALLTGRGVRNIAALAVGGTALALLGWATGYSTGVSPGLLSALRLAALAALTVVVLRLMLTSDQWLPRGHALGLMRGMLLAAVGALVLGWIEVVRPIIDYSPVWRLCVMLLGTAPILLGLSALESWRGLRDRRSRLDSLSLTVTQQAAALERSKLDAERQMRRRAVMEERERFTRDIHDGVGGQLLGLLLRVRTGIVKPDVIATELQAGLHDLRLVVDAMDHTGDDLGFALSTFRARAEAQLRAAGIALDWQQPDDRISHAVGTGGTLQLFRFMQEAVTNIVRHADASRALISIEKLETAGILRIEIADDGVGMDQNTWLNSPGQGLGNLRRRAEVLGATLDVEIGLEGRGLRYRLDLPSGALDMPELGGADQTIRADAT